MRVLRKNAHLKITETLKFISKRLLLLNFSYTEIIVKLSGICLEIHSQGLRSFLANKERIKMISLQQRALRIKFYPIFCYFHI